MYLEHSRLYIFHNNGNPEYYFGSADLMTRNLENRIEVITPIFDADVKEELNQHFETQWSDNVKARIIDKNLSNQYKSSSITRIRAQEDIYAYLSSKYLP
jgi:polyphosphate kinase